MELLVTVKKFYTNHIRLLLPLRSDSDGKIS